MLPIIPVLLAGGQGARLNPLSSEALPKQFMSLPGEHWSLFQQTVMDSAELARGSEILIVAPVGYELFLGEQLAELVEAIPDLSNFKVIIEPGAGGTAAAVMAATAYIRQTAGDAILWVLPCDHHRDYSLKLENLRDEARAAAYGGQIVTFGVMPNDSDSGYGYLQTADAPRPDGVWPVARFIEKPPTETAHQLISSGKAYWNSGMFVFKATVLDREMEVFAPDIHQICWDSIPEHAPELQIFVLESHIYRMIEPEQIDCVIMERSEKLVMIPLPEGWTDIGTFARLHAWWMEHAAEIKEWDFGDGENWSCDAILEAAEENAA